MDVSDIDINEIVPLKTKKVVYASVVGSHIYGWHDDASDVDIHGCFIHPLSSVLSITRPRDVIEMKFDAGIEINLFELEKEIKLIVDNNCNAYESLHCGIPLISSPLYVELVELSRHALSKKIINSYAGLATHNYKKYIAPFINKEPSCIPAKKFLYVMRALMAGIHVLNRGEIISDINQLNEYHNCDMIPQLIDVKKTRFGTNGLNYNRLNTKIMQLFDELKEAEKDSSVIPAEPPVDISQQANRLLYNARIYGADI